LFSTTFDSTSLLETVLHKTVNIVNKHSARNIGDDRVCFAYKFSIADELYVCQSIDSSDKRMHASSNAHSATLSIYLLDINNSLRNLESISFELSISL